MAKIVYNEECEMVRKVEIEIPDSVVNDAVALAIKHGTVLSREEFFNNPEVVEEYIDIYDYEHEVKNEYVDVDSSKIIGMYEDYINLSFDEFDEQYEVEDNPFNEDSQMLTLDEEGEKEYLNSKNENHIWTVIYDDDETYIVPGIRVVNKVGFYITSKPWENPNITVNEE